MLKFTNGYPHFLHFRIFSCRHLRVIIFFDLDQNDQVLCGFVRFSSKSTCFVEFILQGCALDINISK
jgi:hypothetical protein